MAIERDAKYDAASKAVAGYDHIEAQGNTSANKHVLSEYEYDSLGRLMSQTDHVDGSSANDRTTSYDYDLDGRKILESRPDPDGSTNGIHTLDTRYGYDEVGNLVYTIDGIGCAVAGNNHDPDYLKTTFADAN